MISTQVISSSSKGNCYIYNDCIMIDCGIPFEKLIQDYDIKKLKFILISHDHGDHRNIKTLEKIKKINKNIKFFSNTEVAKKHDTIDFIVYEDFYELILNINFEKLSIKITPLYHKSSNGEEIINNGFIIKKENFNGQIYTLFHATDTYKLDTEVIGMVDSLTLEFGHNKANFEDKELESWNIRNFVSHLDEKKAIEYSKKILKKGGKIYPAHMGNSIKKEQLKAKLIDFEVVEWWNNGK